MYETKEEKIVLIKEVIIDIASRLDIQVSVDAEDSLTLGLVFNIATADPHFLIGRQGSHLHALQVLVQAMVARKLRGQEPIYYTIDVDDYKRKREWYLKQTAKQAVEQLRRTGKPIALEAMPNYDRKLIHMYLQDNHPEVFTESAGNEPYRKVVIKLKQEGI